MSERLTAEEVTDIVRWADVIHSFAAPHPSDCVANLCNRVRGLAADWTRRGEEIARLTSPTDGDMTGQANAWVAVWKALEQAGIYGFSPKGFTAKERAVEFIAALKSRAEKAEARVVELEEKVARPNRHVEEIS